VFAGFFFASKVPEFVLVSPLIIVDGPKSPVSFEPILLFRRFDALDAHGMQLHAQRFKRAPQFGDFHPTVTLSSIVIARFPSAASEKDDIHDIKKRGVSAAFSVQM
jgi:hypothetical protein